METIFIFLLKASSGIAVFYLVYWFFLRKETFYSANRWFLLSTLFIAISLPVIPIKYSVITDPNAGATVYKTITDTFKHIPVVSGQEKLSGTFNWQQAILLIYLTGTAIFLLRLLVQTIILLHLIFKYRIKSTEGVKIIENERYGLPFSFFNIVFINPNFHTQEDLPEILAHEKVHIREFHWFDLLFIELLTVIFWFNPFIWFFEHAIKQNHEYLADEGVLAQGHSAGRYKALLINQLMGMQIIGITNNLNYALNTNRFKMMTKTKTSASRRIKLMWALPAIALLLFAFAEPDYRVTTSTQPTNEAIKKDPVFAEKTIKISGTILDENKDPLPGTSVVVKGGTTGTVSDIEGTFKLDIPENASIVLSFVGKETIVVSNTELTSGKKVGDAFEKNYLMKDAVIEIYNSSIEGERMVPPPPPPPPPAKAAQKENKETPPPPPPPKTGEEKEVFYIVEDLPKYPGGYDGLQRYITEMQQKIAQAKGVKGKAKISFTVNGKGKVTDIKVVEKDNDGAAKGAVILASEMQEWTPGKQRGKSVPVKYMLPLEFK